ncbi:DUF2382 domain-containing protein [Dictyobacter arantiisoli]|uniref:DUF2382 domain-containing protein n=1 Tax=Dictyobacter arantiisoli TaxID=2014874 RepID=A0A5A5THN7_9CHLR|nr:DUF2382 domain-containing protein [Dictyobacter arantiisoli]GCF10822.1 hypothetical protein KDI_43860 [Dictyobacter arantiisoli]
MSTDESSMVTGMFRDRTLAEQALDELEGLGWDRSEMRVVGHHSGGVLPSLKKLFTDPETNRGQPDAAFADLDLPEDQQQTYQEDLEQGSTLVAVEPKDRYLEVQDLLHRNGAYHVFLPMTPGDDRTIEVRQEVAKVNKQVVSAGEIRIHKEVITENKTFTVPVRREIVTIERLSREQVEQQVPTMHPETSSSPNLNYPQSMQSSQSTGTADPSATPEDEALPGDGAIRVLVREEQVLISKQTVVVEEILIRKESVQEIHHFEETLKHEVYCFPSS